MLEDGLVAAEANLDRATQHLDRVSPTLSTRFAACDNALDRLSASQRAKSASVVLERARCYLRAAQQTIGDVTADVARGSVGQVREDLRLLERLCAMVDELSAHAARNLAAAPRGRAAPEEQGRGVAADLSSIGQVRLSAQAAGRLAAELAADHRWALSVTPEPVVQRLQAEQQGRRPASHPTGAIGVSR